MPKSNLTLSVDKDLIKRGKRLAREQGTSLSAVFSGYLNALLALPHKRPAIGPLTRMMMGSVRLPAGKTDRELLEDALGEKYGL